jgi:hypothetical protein
MSKNVVIYIPGLGDEKPRGQKLALNLLRIFRIKPYYFAIGWADKDTFDTKLNELLSLVNELHEEGYKINILAASAGASAALNLFAERRKEISSLSLICGKVNNLDKIGKEYYEKNPNFKDSVEMLPKSLAKLNLEDRAKIMSIRPVRDSVVPPKDTIIKGAKNLQSFTFGHSSTIAHYLTVGLPRIIWWIRKKS